MSPREEQHMKQDNRYSGNVAVFRLEGLIPMEFGITIPLQNYLHARKPPYGNMTDPLFCWEVHRFTFAGKDALIAANASNLRSGCRVVAAGLGGLADGMRGFVSRSAVQ